MDSELGLVPLIGVMLVGWCGRQANGVTDGMRCDV